MKFQSILLLSLGASLLTLTMPAFAQSAPVAAKTSAAKKSKVVMLGNVRGNAILKAPALLTIPGLTPVLLQPAVKTSLAEPGAAITVKQRGSSDTNFDKVEGRTFYRWSLAAALAGNAADAISSWHQSEANSVLGGKSGTFGAQSLAIKAGLVGSTFLIQHWALRHNPKLYKSFAWMNVAIAGGLGATAAHNMSIR